MGINSLKVLIVDDELRVGNMYLRVLVEEGFVVRFAEDATKALNYLIREEIDLVLLDINMPGVNGKSIFEIIRVYDPSMKVIVLSAYPLHVQKKMIPQAFDYHDKSDTHSNLLEKIHRLAKELSMK
jgi:DNA-binding NtrC family response regulator